MFLQVSIKKDLNDLSKNYHTFAINLQHVTHWNNKLKFIYSVCNQKLRN